MDKKNSLQASKAEALATKIQFPEMKLTQIQHELAQKNGFANYNTYRAIAIKEYLGAFKDKHVIFIKTSLVQNEKEYQKIRKDYNSAEKTSTKLREDEDYEGSGEVEIQIRQLCQKLGVLLLPIDNYYWSCSSEFEGRIDYHFYPGDRFGFLDSINDLNRSRSIWSFHIDLESNLFSYCVPTEAFDYDEYEFGLP
jgi:hypothetical protein